MGSATPTQQAQDTATECDKAKCGPTIRMPNKQCADGTMSGPTNRCLQHADGTCGWEVKACP
jgi:hypothetical protein